MTLLKSLLSAVGSSLNQSVEYIIDLASPMIGPPADDSLAERAEFLLFLLLISIAYPLSAAMHEAVAYGWSREMIRKTHLLLSKWRETKELKNANIPGPKLFCVFVIYIFTTVLITTVAIPAYICVGGYLLTLKVLEISGYVKPDTKERPSVVTRQMVDSYLYDANSEAAQSFCYTSSSHSFCQVMQFKQLVRMQESHQLANVSSTVTEETCCICIDGFENQQRALLLPCGHFYHFGCILDLRLAKSQTEHSRSQLRAFSCMICQLDLLRHFLFYKEQRWDPKEVPFRNR